MPAPTSALLRSPLLSEVLKKFPVNPKQRDISVTAEGRLFSVKNLGIALRRASPGDRIILPEGDFPIAKIDKRIILQGAVSGTMLKAPLHLSSEFAHLRGLEITGPRGAESVVVDKGIAFLENCHIQGGIRVAPKAALYLRNCLIENAEVGITATQGAYVELHGTRLTNCHSGLVLRDGADAAAYHGRIDHCALSEGTEWGAAVFAEKSSFQGEAVRFEQNGVGAYLTECTSVRLLCCHFAQHEVASIISNGTASSALVVRSCTIEQQTSPRYAQASLTGGSASLQYVSFESTPAVALAVNQNRLDVVRSSFASEDVAVDLQNSHLVAKGLTGRSTQAAALSAVQCRGSIQDGFFLGNPPTALQDSNDLAIASSIQIVSEAETPAPTKQEREIEYFIQRLNQTVSEEGVRAQLERILRQAHAAHHRRLGGMPMPNQSFHFALTGGIGLGKHAAAELLSEAFHHFGITKEPGLYDVDLTSQHPANNNQTTPPTNLDPAKGRAVFISIREATGFGSDGSRMDRALAGLLNEPNTVIILEGEREEMRRLIRTSPMLSQSFHHILYFRPFGPVEFTTYFHQLCQADGIALAEDAAVAVLLLLHIYCDRKDKRFATMGGVRAFYQTARQRYLERSSKLNKFNSELNMRDLALPPEKALLRALESSPAFASFCPSCQKENPWLPGLSKDMVCLHCETPYNVNWGVWKDSAIYRRVTQTTTPIIESGAISRRSHLLVR